jgi:hypothetical protein
MAEETQDAKQETADFRDAGLNAVMETSSTSIDQVSDEPDDTPLGDASGGDTAGAKDKEEPEKKEAGAEEDVPQPYHKDPAWQRLKTARDTARDEVTKEREARIAAESRAKALEDAAKAQPAPVPETKVEELPFKDTSKMSKDEILEWMQDDPVGYNANVVAEATYKASQIMDAKAQKAAQQTQVNTQVETITKALEGYQKDHPDFKEMWDKGEIKKFMEENPLHTTAISAYEAMTLDKRITAATEKAVKEAVEKTRKEFEAKGHATVTHASGTAPVISGSTDDDLKNASGRQADDIVLQRHLERQRAGAGR